MSIKTTRTGRVSNFIETTAALDEIGVTLSQLVKQGLTTSDAPPTAGVFFVPVMDSTGTVSLWRFIGGTGITLTPNAGTRTFTITSP